MTIAREAIFAEAEKLFGEIPGVEEVERMPSGDPTKFDALHIFDGGQRPDPEEEAGTTRYGMVLEVDGYVEGGSGAEAHSRLNTLYGWVVAQIMTEPPIGGLATEVEEISMEVNPAQAASKRRLAFSASFLVHYPTARGSAELIE